MHCRFWKTLSSYVSKIDQNESAIHISGCTLEESFQGREVKMIHEEIAWGKYFFFLDEVTFERALNVVQENSYIGISTF